MPQPPALRKYIPPPMYTWSLDEVIEDYKFWTRRVNEISVYGTRLAKDYIEFQGEARDELVRRNEPIPNGEDDDD